MAIRTKIDGDTTVGAFRRLILRWFGHLLKVVLVRSIPGDHFGLKFASALCARLPIAFVPLVEVVAAQGISPVISVTTVSGIGEHHVFVLIVTNPVPAAFGPDQFLCLPTQTAALLVRHFCRWFCHFVLFGRRLKGVRHPPWMTFHMSFRKGRVSFPAVDVNGPVQMNQDCRLFRLRLDNEMLDIAREGNPIPALPAGGGEPSEMLEYP